MLLILALILLGFVCTFYALCIICDDYLVPAVEVFIEQYNIPEEVAAVTLVAFGSAAPELFLNSVSAVTHTSDLSLSAILGSGMVCTKRYLFVNQRIVDVHVTGDVFLLFLPTGTMNISPFFHFKIDCVWTYSIFMRVERHSLCDTLANVSHSARVYFLRYWTIALSGDHS